MTASKLQHRVKVTVNGKPYVVEVGDIDASPVMVSVNGRLYVVKLEEIESETGSADAQAAAMASLARPTATPEKTPIAMEPVGPTVTQVKAPMPGHIVDIAIRPGEPVRFGQTLCALEAMKMKSAVRSPRDGVIRSVDVDEGQAVSYGDLLFEFE